MNLRPDDLPQIDLTRHLPTLKDSLSHAPQREPEPTIWQDALSAAILCALFLAALFVLFGYGSK